MTALPFVPSYQRAAQRTIEVLLNCYIREYARPKGVLRVTSSQNFSGALGEAPAILVMDFPHLAQTCAVAVQLPERNGYRYLSEPYLLGQTPRPRVLDWQKLATLIIDELGQEYPQAFNSELLHQVANSFSHLQQFLAYQSETLPQGSPLQVYLQSERSLAAGHRHHPAPKAREGMSEEELFLYSPELGGEFQLEYFAVEARDFLHRHHQGSLEIASRQRELSGCSENWLVGIHPWQASYLQRQEVFQQLLLAGRIRPLGQSGAYYQATASVRTLYCPQLPWFAKLSLHLRLTNCLRKNAWYELESALLLDPLLQQLPHPFSSERFGFLSEPAYTTVDLVDLADGPRRFLREAMATLFRDNTPIVQSQEPLVMAAALFGGRDDSSWLQRLLADVNPLDWFAEYCGSVVWPALYFYAEHGVIFEPHLQNTLLRLKNGRPAGVLFRDLEGTKLLQDRWRDSLQGRGERQVVHSILYHHKQAWCRFCYCLIFNQLAEVVDGLVGVEPKELWRVVRDSLQQYLEAYGTDQSRPLVDKLLNSQRLPFKANLLTRFLKERDSRATYLWIENPLQS